MLVLTRKLGEQIVIDGGIIITVVACHKARVRLGVSAPAQTKVNRREVHDKMVQEDFFDTTLEEVEEEAKSLPPFGHDNEPPS